jgi:hypothetical protein
MQQIIDKTRLWVEKVVVGFNFCPFAYREVEKGSIRYVVSEGLNEETILTDLLMEMEHLDANEDTETTLLPPIIPIDHPIRCCISYAKQVWNEFWSIILTRS